MNWPQPFESITEVKTYLAKPRIQCLLCAVNGVKASRPRDRRKIKEGFISLADHLVKSHGVSADAYREKLSIPYTYALTSKDCGRKRCGDVKRMLPYVDLEKAHTAPRRKRLQTVAKQDVELARKRLGDYWRTHRCQKP